MTNFGELRDAVNSNKKLIWNDPDPIEGNDYLIDEINDFRDIEDDFDGGILDDEVMKDYIFTIQYGGGSEAEVTMSEIDYATERKDFIISDGLADAQEAICQGIYEKDGPSKVFDYSNKVNMPYSYCKPCDNFTPTVVRKETDTCGLCGQGKPIKEKYSH